MRILFIIHQLNIGGAEILLKDLSIKFVNEGHNITIYLFNTINSYLEEELEKRNVKLIKNKSTKINSFHTFFKLVKFLYNNKFDIIHSHLYFPQIFTALASKIIFLKTPLITTEHSTYYQRRESFIYRLIDKVMYKFYNKIICISYETEKVIKKLYPNMKNKCITIYNGIDLSKFEMNKKKINKTNFIILNVGRIEKLKNQILLINIMPHLKEDIYLMIVGEGHLKEELKRRAKELGVENRVKFVGMCTNIQEIMQEADVLVQPSLWEGFGLTIVEAMASGLPVIASNVGGMKEIVKNYGLLFEINNEEQLIKYISILKENKEKRLEIANKCKKRSYDFDISKTYQNYLTLYQQLVK